MARQFLTGLNLNRNELQNARIQNLATDPGSAVEGQVYYNTVAHEMRVYNGTIWEAVGLNGVTADASEINILDGATLTTAELNILDGATLTVTELNVLDGITSSTAELNILDGATLTVSELNILDGATLTVSELNVLDGITADVNELNILNGATLTVSELNVLDGITADVTELNILDGATVTAAELNILDGATLTTTELNFVDGVTSGIQGQLDLKAPINNPVFTGTVSLVSDLVFEGASANDFETTVTATDPTADRTITLPDNSGTVILSTNTVNSLAVPTAEFSMNSQKIVSLADPTNPQDAATKAYVDAARSGLDVKASVRVATTANITLEGEQTVDGVALVAGNRVLVKNQDAGAENGIYVVAAGSWARADDANSDTEVTAGMFTFVSEGTVNGDSGFVLTTNDTITLDTTALVFVQFSGAGQITAGNGLTKTGNTIDAVGTADRVTVNADSIDIASTYVGQTSITTLGTVTTGTWNATDVGVEHGGTGSSTAAGARANLGATTKFTAANTELTPSSGAVTWVVTHNLGIRTVLVQIYDLSTYEEVEVDIARTDTNTVTLSWVSSATVAADAYQVVVVG